MDVVQIFNDELQSLIDMKPPVSKAKMGQITRAAMKGVKFYKHIVQSVEKFVARCTNEYKVPGLYVIDSIVRQSRHQFGIDRDVYASRFSRNLGITFENLFTGCSPEDKSKIVRVLNLWQKNGVFNAHVIQPLLDMASPSTAHQMDPKSPNSVDNSNSTSRQQGQTSKYNSQQYSGDSNLSSSGRHQRNSEGGLKFSKNMLDFDYDEDDEDDGDETPTEAEPPLSSTLSKIEMETRRKIDKANSMLYQSSQKMNPDRAHSPQQQPQRQQQPPSQDPVLERWNRIIRQQAEPNDSLNSSQHSLISGGRITQRRSRSRSPVTARPQTSSSFNSTYSHQITSNRSLPYATRESNDEHQAKIESGERKSIEIQRSSMTTTMTTTTSTTTTTTLDKERAAERERKCLPKIRDKHLTVCSSTLWLGHVPKTVSEADISDAFGEYGTINSIDLIPPRGCAYVCMDRRQDAKRALNESRDLKLNGSHIKMAWAPGKGFKEYKKLKDFWEADVGASFIPYSKVDESIDFETLEEGGVIDEDSMSMEMRERRERKSKGHLSSSSAAAASNIRPPTTTATTTATGLSLPMPVMPMMNQPPPPTSIQPFAIPPPNLSIPPPVALGQGLIPFPPPNVITSASSSGPMLAPHLQQQPPLLSSSLISQGEPSQDSDNNSEHGSPLSLEQQLSMTERQISMVEQQLNMIQQAQGMGGGPNQGPHPPPMSLMQNLPPQAAMFFPHNQPNHPMMFDMPGPHQMLPPGMAPMLDPQQMAMFMNHPMNMMGGNQPMIPMSQASMLDPNNMGDMGQHHGGF